MSIFVSYESYFHGTLTKCGLFSSSEPVEWEFIDEHWIYDMCIWEIAGKPSKIRKMRFSKINWAWMTENNSKIDQINMGHGAFDASSSLEWITIGYTPRPSNDRIIIIDKNHFLMLNHILIFVPLFIDIGVPELVKFNFRITIINVKPSILNSIMFVRDRLEASNRRTIAKYARKSQYWKYTENVLYCVFLLIHGNLKFLNDFRQT